MNRKLLNGLLVLAVAAGGVGTFTSCKDEDFRNDVLVGQISLQDQLDAIRDLTDDTFKSNLQAWLDDQDLDKIWEMIKEGPAGNHWDVLEPYIQGLYDYLFQEIFPGEEWFQQIQVNLANIDNINMRPASVEVSHVVNPAFGGLSTPLGINSTIFATYEFKPSNGSVNFPAVDASDIAWGYDEAALSTINAIASAQSLSKGFSDPVSLGSVELGNLGGALVTINPSDVDFSDDKVYTYNFVNSLGETVLSSANKELALAKYEPGENDEAIKFGTKAAVPGVYTLSATATESNYEDLYLAFDKSSVKDAFENFLSNKDLADIASLGKVLLDAVNNKVPALALEVSWKEQEATALADGGYELDGDEVKFTESETANTYKTGYDYAAIVAHPLSYANGVTLANKIKDRFDGNPQLPTFNSPLSDYIKKINDELDDLISDIDLVEPVKVEFKYTGEGGTIEVVVYDENGEKIGTAELSYSSSGIADPEPGSLDAFLADLLESLGNDSQKQINTVIDSINKSIGTINDQLKRLQAKVKDYSSDSKINRLQSLIDYYNRFANRINDVISDPAKYFQICALYETVDGGVAGMSTLATDGIVAGGAFDMFLTSYNGELIVPAYKKYVAITAIDGVPATAADNTGDLNTVLSGDTDYVTVALPASAKSGQTLTVTYMAVDYHGVCSMQNYYVKVK
ncbi:MAG: hypothetical protein J1F38_06895 [Muribaculaceae bacterium]|nr:hypothetical protein [Muribaculaceae bacterium]